ncbi:MULTISPECIES: chorismate mutase [unclassified Methanoregula]|uniref:chorismate mutase n=1 Tax=unclassified Methanoregula TaxID=2649730 RepID=UPI0009C7671C|nr:MULTISPECIES: chorismate mutase [unclassified Methanoregula]OPX64257.1 MAG: chorismate mutase [Methanoregula sp. PtaB.Bin085]OPY33618.1 MAG: chorismate mutase [Methanoregula sp. PtaU1.Bin006]
MSLDAVRAEISKVDSEIIRLIAERQKLAGRIARIKIAHSLPVHDGERANNVLESVYEQATERRIDAVSVRKIFEILIAMSEERQRECSGDGNLP